MNYMAELLAFDIWIETNELSASAINLWFGLMQTANRCGWKNPFCVSISTLETRTGLHRDAIYRARNRLKQAGLVSFRERTGNKSAEYTLVSLKTTQTATQPATQAATQTATQPATQAATIPKPNKTKQDEPPISPEIADAVNEFKAFRANVKKPMTDRAVSMLLTKLDGMAADDDTKVAILRQSVFRGWTDIYPLKNASPGEGRYDNLQRLFEEVKGT